MRVVIAGGGTGGHLFPGIALAEELRARGGNEVLFVGTERGIEARVLPREGFPLELIDVAGLKGKGIGGLLRGMLRVPRAFLQSLSILRRFRPDLVVGVGGYSSGPLVLAAALTGRPTAILEQNSVPGITNRILGHLVRAIFSAFDESKRYFPTGKTQLVGNPIRAQMQKALTEHAESAPGASPLVLICGGSQGARAVNDLAAAAIALLAASGRAPRVLHQTGAADAERIAARYRQRGLEADVRPFIDDMASAYRAADLIVGRAGATTLAELTAIGRPAILIPFPFAADDHQTKNAEALAVAGAARILVEKSTTPDQVAATIAELLGDRATLAKMADAARSLGRPQAAQTIVDQLERMVERPR